MVAEQSGPTDIMAFGKQGGLECALIEPAKCGYGITRSLAVLVEDKGTRMTRYAQCSQPSRTGRVRTPGTASIFP